MQKRLTKTAKSPGADPESAHFRRICLIVREQFRDNPTDGWADVKEAIKCRCAQLRLPYGGSVIDRAMAFMAPRMTRSDDPSPQSTSPPVCEEARPLTQEQTLRMLRELAQRSGLTPIPRGMR
jgi:hypothetical protein